jgi:hypothetical protein
MTITVQFTGICTHLQPPGHPTHRVHLVEARNGGWHNERKIPPHIPKLIIDPKYLKSPDQDIPGLERTDKAGTWILRGVYLDLEGTQGEPFRQDETCDIPHLKTDDPGIAISNEVTLNEMAAAYFDFEHGVLKSATVEEAIVGIIEVEAASPSLHVKCFWSREESWIQLTDDAKIDIVHVGTVHGDSDHDFLLHYRVFDSVPGDAFEPEKAISKKKNPGDISIGCSNSQYP